MAQTRVADNANNVSAVDRVVDRKESGLTVHCLGVLAATAPYQQFRDFGECHDKLELSQDLHFGALAAQIIKHQLATCAALGVHAARNRHNIGVCLVVRKTTVLRCDERNKGTM